MLENVGFVGKIIIPLLLGLLFVVTAEVMGRRLCKTSIDDNPELTERIKKAKIGKG